VNTVGTALRDTYATDRGQHPAAQPSLPSTRGGTPPPLETGPTSYRIYGESPTVKSSIRALMLGSKTGGVSARRARWPPPCGAPAVGSPIGPATNSRRSRAGVAQSAGHAAVSPGWGSRIKRDSRGRGCPSSTNQQSPRFAGIGHRHAYQRHVERELHGHLRGSPAWAQARRPVARTPCLLLAAGKRCSPHLRCPDATSAEQVGRSGFITYRLPSRARGRLLVIIYCTVHISDASSDDAVQNAGGRDLTGAV
jgi:hypothetical protein